MSLIAMSHLTVVPENADVEQSDSEEVSEMLDADTRELGPSPNYGKL